jgi:PHD/YefM family antitoxin component YafN of YafNO toxin-antitoxin module
MLKEQCISVTDLRTKTKECLEDLQKEPKYIFINNHPVAVLVDIDVYEKHFMKPELLELDKDSVDGELMKAAEVAKKSKKKDMLNI